MSAALSTALPTALAGPPPTPTAAAPAAASAAPSDFAQRLDEAREPNPAPSPGATAPMGAAKGKPATPSKAERPVDADVPADSARAADAPPSTAGDALDAQVLPAEAATEAHDTTPAPVDLSALLPGWVAPPAAPAVAAAPRSAVAGGVLAAVAAGTSRSEAATSAAPVAAAANADKAAAVATDTSLPTPAAPRSAARDADAALGATPLPQAAPAAPPTAAASSAPAAPASAHLPVPPQHPGFAPALATQVRWWAHDGVQQAQLTLNPAEMGPVAVQIVIDGREARIDFSADAAATRQALEASLPVLAAALDDSGLKLAGGGVHDGQAQRQDAWAAARAGQSAASAMLRGQAGPAGPEPGAARPVASRGLVDLVA